MILVDAHVHIYNCFDLEKFFDSAYSNFKFEAEKLGHGDEFSGILLLAEASKDNWFQHLSEFADGKDLPNDEKTGKWKFYHTNESCSLLAKYENLRNLTLIAGRQVVTEEELELLALGTTALFNDGTPISELIEIVKEKGGIPVIPWGVGKWLGKRRRVMKRCLQNKKNFTFFLGDNSGRPIFWPRPGIFKKGETKGIRVLPGSDPLPLADEFHRVGKFGLMISGILSTENPARDLKKILINSAGGFLPYGRLERPFRFFYNQFKLKF